MTGSLNGVRTRIEGKYPQAKYFVHCRSHQLNLVMASSCKNVPEVRNFMGIVKLSWFLAGSSKRKAVVIKVLKSRGHHGKISMKFDLITESEAYLFDCDRVTMPSLCETRWLARVDTLSWLLENYSKTIKSLEEIAEVSSGQSASDAVSYIMSLTSFQYIICCVVVQFVLGYSRPLSTALQAVDCNLPKAHEDARSLVNVSQDLRDSDNYDLLFKRATTIAEKLNVTPQKPRTAGRQMHRPNSGGNLTSLEDNYKMNIFLPFVDHVLQHLNDRFPQKLMPLMLAWHLIPCNVSFLTDENVQAIRLEYEGDLPSIGVATMRQEEAIASS